MNIVFVTGIDTGVGKTVVTGLWARRLLGQGRRVLTAKLVQTGAAPGEVAEDIRTHRRLMGLPLLPCDEQGWTCPYVFRFPASPHLAGRLENRSVEPGVLDRSWQRLADQCDWLLLEGAGGLEVPLRGDLTILDYVADRGFPVLVVTGPRLGSLNHTLLTVYALQTRGLRVLGLAYNLALAAEPEITADTRAFFRQRWPGLPLWDVPACDPALPEAVDLRQVPDWLP
ncbi:MAG: dethiobiotin synthase [candidate division FCPU426 bacterium]